MKGKPVLRLEKYSEQLEYGESYNIFDMDSRRVCEDVSRMSETKLVRILEKLYKELHPDDDDDGSTAGAPSLRVLCRRACPVLPKPRAKPRGEPKGWGF